MKKIFYLFILIFLPSLSFAQAETNIIPDQIALFVIKSESQTQLLQQYDLDYLMAANYLFEALPENSKNNDIWEALYKMRLWFDGAAHEEYGYMANSVFTKNPTIFYSRFLSGDSRAIILTQDAFIPGTWVLEGSLEEENQLTPEIFGKLESAIKILKAIRPPRYKYDLRALHDAYMERTEKILKEWPEQRRDLLDLIK